MIEALDIAPGAAKWLPVGQSLLRRLVEGLDYLGLASGRRKYATPDGQGMIIVRAARDTPKDEWFGYIKITGGIPGGFIVTPYIRRISPDQLRNIPQIQIPYAKPKLLPFPDYISMSTLPHVGKGNSTTTGAAEAPYGDVKGAFVKTKFTGGFLGGTVSGVFTHKYTDSNTGDPTTKLISVTSGGILKDAATGVDLTRNISPSLVSASFTVNANGTGVVLEAINPDGIYDATPPNSGVAMLRYHAVVDYAADPQVMFTEITDSPYVGAVTTVGETPASPAEADSVGTLSYTMSKTVAGSIVFPVAYGVNAAGAPVSVDVVETHGLDMYRTEGYTFADADQGAGVTNVNISGATNETLTANTYLDLRLPNGVTKRFDGYVMTQSDVRSYSRAYSTPELGSNSISINITYTYSGLANISNIGQAAHYTVPMVIASNSNTPLKILYCDPAVPVVVYEYLKWVRTGLTAVALTVNPNTLPALPGPLETTISREVGILIGDTARSLFTDTATTVTNTSDQAPYNPNGGVAGVSASTTTGNVATHRYAKQLRRVHDVSVVTGYMGAKYVMDIRDEKNWIVGVTKLKDMDDNDISTFDVYTAPGMDAIKTKQRIIDYMAEYLAGDPAADPPVEPVDAVAAADLTAGNLTPYEIRLHTSDTGSFI